MPISARSSLAMATIGGSPALGMLGNPAAVTGGSGGSGGALAPNGAGMSVPLPIGGAVVPAAGTGTALVARRRRA
ncbi:MULTISPECIES: hypothetical protein [unclassified Streptomyces]|uniref:hypothetical protein n=1 Tax=unclassified Streptomyces TaxID=2593676 RepID=UPI001BEAF6CE|nr:MULTISPECIES: hypothetical protein [unclassified Streptomyces]MBT2407131.1 hypothetical protein [Streptomyces sp. ISL-21]MBT2612779.1 hypothetical protein [Streptomyces sp. ISL-87]